MRALKDVVGLKEIIVGYCMIAISFLYNFATEGIGGVLGVNIMFKGVLVILFGLLLVAIGIVRMAMFWAE